MKTTYIAYRLVGEKIELISHRGLWSGLVLSEPHPAVTEIGSVNIFNEDSDMAQDPVERFVFGIYDLAERIPYGSHITSIPAVLFESKSFEYEEIRNLYLGTLQRSVIMQVIKREPFTGHIRFLKKTRSVAKEIDISPLTPA